ncbi:hypothetical protein EYF80_051764 [Liparis tanakae]|uniref:Uncharacterized protein n=1 Tax=Liparis tanakae TaxID=230148 RepID=A0A4Z2FA01_9TELE|nr:hypothetical protein EYF80_051764 [Liparis tanakae]
MNTKNGGQSIPVTNGVAGNRAHARCPPASEGGGAARRCSEEVQLQGHRRGPPSVFQAASPAPSGDAAPFECSSSSSSSSSLIMPPICL